MIQRPEIRWRGDLQPFADLYNDVWHRCHAATAHKVVEEAIGLLPSFELLKLREAAADATATNCWWATYHVAKIALSVDPTSALLARRLS